MSAAARALGISPPNITKSIPALESQLRGQPLQRPPPGGGAPRFGRLLYSRAKVAQSELLRAEQELGELAGHQAGSVAFGLGPVVADLVMPPAMAAFRRQFPLAGVRIFEAFAHTLVPMVRDETL